jgi:hypothetical protein
MFSVWTLGGITKPVDSGVVEAAMENAKNKRVQPFVGAEGSRAVARREYSCGEGKSGRSAGWKEGHAWTKEGVKPEQERSDVASLAHGLHDAAGYIIAKQAAPHAHDMMRAAARGASSSSRGALRAGKKHIELCRNV